MRETRAALGIAPEKKIILFLMSHSHYQPFDARIFLDWMKRRGDVVAVFKWHPVTSKEIVERALERMPKDAPVINAPSFDTYRLIGASDICITVGNSTTGLESIAFGKPLLECRLPDQAYSFVEQGVAEPAAGFEDIGEKCAAILSDGLPEARRQQVEKYLAYNFAYQDNQTMERIVELVSESLVARGKSDAVGCRRSTLRERRCFPARSFCRWTTRRWRRSWRRWPVSLKIPPASSSRLSSSIARRGRRSRNCSSALGGDVKRHSWRAGLELFDRL